MEELLKKIPGLRVKHCSHDYGIGIIRKAEPEGNDVSIKIDFENGRETTSFLLLKCLNRGILSFDAQVPAVEELKSIASLGDFRCDHCGNVLPRIEYLSDNPFLPKGKYICNNCLDLLFPYCESCLSYYPEEMMITVDGFHICPDCAKTDVLICSKCGNQYYRHAVKDPQKGLCYSCRAEETRKQAEKEYLEFWGSYDSTALKVCRYSVYDLQNIKLVPFMSQFHSSQKKAKLPYYDALILHTVIGDLFIVHSGHYNNKIQFPTYGIKEYIMSDIKKNSFRALFHIDDEKPDSGVTFKLSDNQLVNVWKRPFKIRAQTVYDKDYRTEWNGDEIVYQGNYFSDTSNFYVIGNLINLS